MAPSDPSFAEIRSLFRPTDVESMSFIFDLSSYADVRHYSEEIYERLSDGTMPCDEPWEEQKVQVLRTWVEHGCPP